MLEASSKSSQQRVVVANSYQSSQSASHAFRRRCTPSHSPTKKSKAPVPDFAVNVMPPTVETDPDIYCQGHAGEPTCIHPPAAADPGADDRAAARGRARGLGPDDLPGRRVAERGGR